MAVSASWAADPSHAAAGAHAVGGETEVFDKEITLSRGDAANGARAAK